MHYEVVQHYFSIREQDPLKQGLKPYKILESIILIKIREQDPLKQGLKLRVWFFPYGAQDYS